MTTIPIGLQLWSVRDDCGRDLPGTLKAVADMGYQGVEFAGYHGRSAAELRNILDDLGLKAAGTHLGLAQLLGDELERTIEFNKELGSKYAIIAMGDAEQIGTRAALLNFSRTLNEIADKLKGRGIRTGYHNHWHEFDLVDGETAWDAIASNTQPDVVMQLDLGNAMRGGANPTETLAKWVDRAFSVHLKEHSTTKDEPLVGEGDVPWQEVFRICETAGKTEWYVVEQEAYPVPPLQAAEQCLKHLRAMGK